MPIMGLCDAMLRREFVALIALKLINAFKYEFNGLELCRRLKLSLTTKR